ncbi:Zinc finger, RING-type [Sesbania bispinosa]|nr:Zinc finger, RING-type [Sesbania bispinosa]
MDILKFLLHLFIFFPVICASSEDCQYSWCSENNILIRFPFQLEGQQHPYCGYPGFNLTCTNDSKTVLNFPYSGEFYVRNINYLRQQIQIYDPDACLPKRLLSLNLSASPFNAAYLSNYTFLSCPTRNTGPQFIPVDCLSNSTHFVSAIPSVNLTNSLPEYCHVIRNLSVPVSRSGRYEEIFRDQLSEDLRLTWYSPDCRYCELQDGRCGFESRNSDQVRCFSDNQTGRSRDGLRVFRIILLSIAGPAVMCAIGMACFKHRSGISSAPRISAVQRFAPTAILISPQPAITMVGLDESTIESFQKLVLGESRRLPGPNDGFCSICLSEYSSKETIRCIPECSHCFHAHCIDEWLRMNSTCPLCRNSPSPSPLVMSSNP